METFIRRIFGKETHEKKCRAVSHLSPNMNCLPSASSALAHNRGDGFRASKRFPPLLALVKGEVRKVNENR